MNKSTLLFIIFLLPVVGIILLLGWSVVRSEGMPGGILVNSTLGELEVSSGSATDFSIETLEGQILELSDLRGKIVMLDFWSSWCPPCRTEAPDLEHVSRQYRDLGVEFIGIAIWDREEDVRSFLKRYQVNYINGLDKHGLIAVDYGVRGIPEKYFIDRQGNLVRKFVGPMGLEDLEEVLDQLIAH